MLFIKPILCIEKIKGNVMRFDNDIIGLLLFFFAIFCGLWAQKTQRNYWLWFITGFFFAPEGVRIFV